MFLTRVRLELFEHGLTHRFDVSVSTVSDVVVTWANYLYILLGSLPVLPSCIKREDKSALARIT